MFEAAPLALVEELSGVGAAGPLVLHAGFDQVDGVDGQGSAHASGGTEAEAVGGFGHFFGGTEVGFGRLLFGQWLQLALELQKVGRVGLHLSLGHFNFGIV